MSCWKNRFRRSAAIAPLAKVLSSTSSSAALFLVVAVLLLQQPQTPASQEWVVESMSRLPPIPHPIPAPPVIAPYSQVLLPPERPQGSEERPIGFREGQLGEEDRNELGGEEEGQEGRDRDENGDCCFKVKVAFTRGHANGAYQLHSYMFGHFEMEPGSVNGRPHYTSVDGRFSLAYCGDSWWVQKAANRGECLGWAHSGWQTDVCVSDIEYTWRFYIPEIDTFINADKGLSVWCKS